MRRLIIMIALLPAFSGCKTSKVGAVKGFADDAQGSGVNCTFASPLDPGEKFEVRVGSVSNGKLKNVEISHTISGKAQAKRNLSEALRVEGSELTSNGRREIQSCFKSIVEIDYNKFACYSLETVAARASFLCLAQLEDDASTAGSAFWATNLSSRHYPKNLTYYDTKCQPTR